MEASRFVIPSSSGDITLETGQIAQLADGAVLVTKGGTSILAAATVNEGEPNNDFFPLTVEYLERYYAAGTLSGSRFNKREGFPSEYAITVARQVDHAIRPLFPKDFQQEVNVVLTLMADDGKTNPESLTVLAASAALSISGIPFAGPAASAVVEVDEGGELHLSPEKNGDLHQGEFVITAANGKLMNIEGEAKQVSEEKMDEIIDFAMEEIAQLNEHQQEFAANLAKPAVEYQSTDVAEELLTQLEQYKGDLEAALYTADPQQRDNKKAEVQKQIIADVVTEDSTYSKDDVEEAIDFVCKKIMRSKVLQEEKRFSGRALDEIRTLDADVDLLPSVHGSALFSRGYTQSLSIVTLGSTSKSTGFDELEGVDISEPFLHHYNFPPYSVGEAGRIRYKPGRREIGHGMIGQKGLQNVIAIQEDFPYTIRVVSEITGSNGSTSMAATCASSMALMAAGVPMESPVAGIGVGLVTDDPEQNDYKLLTDIEGVEDHYGDMDFKVTGTENGITAIQFETKLQGVKPEIIKEAFRVSKQGRLQVLETMNSVMPQSREQIAETAPKVKVLEVPQSKIGEVIGPGGKVIRGIIDRANEMYKGKSLVEIDINDEGRISVTADTTEQMEYAVNQINQLTEEPEVGKVYTGKVAKITEYGAFVDVNPNISGLLHISEIADEHVKDVNEYLEEGQKVDVKLIKQDGDRLSFSLKQVDNQKQE